MMNNDGIFCITICTHKLNSLLTILKSLLNFLILLDFSKQQQTKLIRLLTKEN